MKIEKINFSATLIFFVAISIQLLILDTHPVSIPIDGYAYIDSTSWLRPHGYDFFLLLSGIKLFNNFSLIIIIQTLLVSLIPVMIFLSLNLITNQRISLLISIIFLFYTHPSILSVQLMSESLYIFGCSLILFLLVKYITQPNFKILIFLCFTVFITNEIRPSIAIIYLALIPIIALIVLKKKKRPLKDLIFVLIIFLVNVPGSFSVTISSPKFGPENDQTISIIGTNKHFNLNKNTVNLFPFWMLHYLPYTKLYNEQKWHFKEVPNIQFHPENGPFSKEFFEKITMMAKNEEFFRYIIGKRDLLGGVESNIDIIDKKDVEKTIIKILSNTNDGGHLWPQLIDKMYREFGFKYTGKICRGMISETLINNSNFLTDIYFPVLKRNIQKKTATDEIYHYFIPDKKTKFNNYPTILDPFPLNSSAYSAWVYNQDIRIGRDIYKINSSSQKFPYSEDFKNEKPSLKQTISILFKKSDISDAYIYNGNKFAYFNFILHNLNRIFIFLVITILPLVTVLSYFSKFFLVSVLLSMSNVLLICIAQLIIPDPRTYGMHMIFFAPVLATGIHGAIIYLKKRY